MQNLRRALLTSRFARAAKLPTQRILGEIGYELRPKQKSYEDFIRDLSARQRIGVLVDVGANQGQFAREFRDRGFGGRIISFEPMHDAFSRLKAQASSDTQWEVRQVALGDAAGEAELHVTANSVSSSLLPISAHHAALEPTSRIVRSEAVRVSTLDSELHGEPPKSRFWLKLDVQGYEGAVLAGGEAALARTHVVQCELSNRELYHGQSNYLAILQRLDLAGFTPVYVLPGFSDPLTGEMLQFDIIAARLPDVSVRDSSGRPLTS